MAITRGRAFTGIGIIIAGIAFISLGFALTSQTPEPETGAEGLLDGLIEWGRNVGITFTTGLGTGLGYLGWPVMFAGIILLVIWHFRD